MNNSVRRNNNVGSQKVEPRWNLTFICPGADPHWSHLATKSFTAWTAAVRLASYGRVAVLESGGFLRPWTRTRLPQRSMFDFVPLTSGWRRSRRPPRSEGSDSPSFRSRGVNDSLAENCQVDPASHGDEARPLSTYWISR